MTNVAYMHENSGKSVKCKDEYAVMSSVSKMTKKNWSENVKLQKNRPVKDETFDPQSFNEKRDDMSRTRENSSSSSRSTVRKIIKNKVSGNMEKNSTAKAKETVLNCKSTTAFRSKSGVASSKRLIKDESFHQRSNEHQPISKRVKQLGTPAVHIQRLNSTEPVLFSLCDKYDNIGRSRETESAKIVLPKTEATNLSEGQNKNCQLLDPSHGHEIRVKDEPSLVVGNEVSENKQIHDWNNDCDLQEAEADNTDVKHENKRDSKEAFPVLRNFDDKMKSVDYSLNGSESSSADCSERLKEDKQSDLNVKNAASGDNSCGDVVVLSVDNSRSKARRRLKSEVSRKRCGADDIVCRISMHEHCVEAKATTAEVVVSETTKVNDHELIHTSPNKMSKKNSKDDGSKAVKKTRLASCRHSAFSGSKVTSSIMTRSMIRIPG